MDLFSRIGNDSPSRRFIFQGVHPGARTLRKSVLVNREVPLERWRRIRPRDDKEKEGGGEREKKNALQEGREKGQSLVNRASKHPQGSMANHILTRIYTRSVARKEGEEEVAATAEVPTIKWKKWKYVCPAFLRSHDNVWTANKRVATIGGANAHSRRDRLSFVTSFTLSNDTHCFWTRSYASRPGTWHRLEAGFIISFFFSFFRVPPLPRVPVCTAPTYTRALSLPPCIVSLSSCFPLLFPRCSCLRDG